MNQQLMNRQAWLLTSCYRAVTSKVVQIPVTYVPTEEALGTEDGSWYHVYPDGPDSDEEGAGHGRN
jgi:hypothetical protein